MLSCVQLFETPMDCSPSGSSVHRIFQAGILEQVANFFSRRSSQSRDQTHVSCISNTGRRILSHCTTWEALSPTGVQKKFSEWHHREIFLTMAVQEWVSPRVLSFVLSLSLWRRPKVSWKGPGRSQAFFLPIFHTGPFHLTHLHSQPHFCFSVPSFYFIFIWFYFFVCGKSYIL